MKVLYCLQLDELFVLDIKYVKGYYLQNNSWVVSFDWIENFAKINKYNMWYVGEL